MLYIYGDPSKARNANVVYIYIYIHTTFGNTETVSFYLLHNVSTLNQCREFSCVTFVCKKLCQLAGKVFTHKCDTGNLSALIQC